MPDRTDPQAWVTEAQDNYRDAWEYPYREREAPLLAAAAAAQIAQAMVMIRDSVVMAQEIAAPEVDPDLRVSITAAAGMAETLDAVEQILEQAKEKGPRNPAIYKALEVLKGE